MRTMLWIKPTVRVIRGNIGCELKFAVEIENMKSENVVKSTLY